MSVHLPTHYDCYLLFEISFLISRPVRDTYWKQCVSQV
jgi:hypothetical protein